MAMLELAGQLNGVRHLGSAREHARSVPRLGHLLEHKLCLFIDQKHTQCPESPRNGRISPAEGLYREMRRGARGLCSSPFSPVCAPKEYLSRVTSCNRGA